MNTYSVHFSYYSEEYGQFDEAIYRVDAENQFDARQKGWEAVDSDDNRRFMSCLRQTGVSWEATPINLPDYFNALAADCKCRIKAIENIDIPNSEISHDEDKRDRVKNELSYYLGRLDSISDMAKDIGKPFGMAPPDIFEELHYAEGFVQELDNKKKNPNVRIFSVIRGLARILSKIYIDYISWLIYNGCR